MFKKGEGGEEREGKDKEKKMREGGREEGRVEGRKEWR
jgi:hypothetical protein